MLDDEELSPKRKAQLERYEEAFDIILDVGAVLFLAWLIAKIFHYV